MNVILITIAVAFALAFLLGLLLGVFKKIFAVPVNETAVKVREALPGANCGGCGFPGCDGYAAAVAEGTAEPNLCAPGGASVASSIAKILGKEASIVKKAAVVCCRGTNACAQSRGKYKGVQTCAAAVQAINGTKMCAFGCSGFGDCVAACKFSAIKIGPEGIPVIDENLCAGCGGCVKACPKHLISVLETQKKIAVALCKNRSDNKPSILKNCKNGCIKCGKCEKMCEFGAIKLQDGVPAIDSQKCTACGKCVEGCPTHVLTIFPF